MNILRNISTIVLLLIVAVSCNIDEDRLYSFDEVTAPSNVSAIVDVTQDNSGLVTILPNADGASVFKVTFGDSLVEVPTEYKLKEEITHTYSEGTFTLGITAVGLTGLESEEFTKEIVLSFDPPENLKVTVENDPSVSKQVNISATADYATLIEFYFGEEVGEVPTIADPGKTVSHVYAEPGDYIIKVIAKSAAIQTLESQFHFTVTEILGPVDAAPDPQGRVDTDVISIFSGAYTDLANTDFNPDWGQSTVVTTNGVAGNSTMKYANLNYQGTAFENAVDASGMEFLHIDMWTLNASAVNIFLISTGDGKEKASALTITSGEWVSYDIPLSEFSDIVDLADVIQLKIDGTEGSSIYLDNIYFYKEGASTTPSLPIDFESSVLDYDWQDFDGGAATVIDNPQSAGINTSGNVVQMVKDVGKVWGGSWIALDAPIDFSVNKTFKMKVYSPKVGTEVLFKVENMSDSDINKEVRGVFTTVANEWEELTFDFGDIDTQEYQKLIIIFDMDIMGDGTADFTYLFDDIVLTN